MTEKLKVTRKCTVLTDQKSMVKILSFAATYRTSIMPNSEGMTRQLSDLIVRMFAMNGITFLH